MTTNRGNDASAQSATQHEGQRSRSEVQAVPTPVSEAGARQGPLSRFLRIHGKRVFATHAAFPLLFALLFLDRFFPLQGIAFLLGMLFLSGLCAEEYLSFLRSKGLPVPPSLGFHAGFIPALIAFCWRLPSQPAISPGLLTIVTLALVFCTLMVALSLIAEVSEKMVLGLAAFCIACAGALLIGTAFGHLLLLRQLGLGLKPLLAAVVAGWVGNIVSRLWKCPLSSLTLLSRFSALAAAAVTVFWGLRAFLR